MVDAGADHQAMSNTTTGQASQNLASDQVLGWSSHGPCQPGHQIASRPGQQQADDEMSAEPSHSIGITSPGYFQVLDEKDLAGCRTC